MSVGHVSMPGTGRRRRTGISGCYIINSRAMRTSKTFKYDRVFHKVCAGCGSDLDIREFRLQWKNDDGTPKKEPHKDLCRICDRERMLRFVDEHPDYVGAETKKDDDHTPIIV
jgi:hypothetical protein